eukprot:TRINITY_DN16500_c0_g2_i1.p1 TRINITY_DN16500_c0_g2~~TRINITY_DN16500_c0_g2_i1.p1  ORF type:complete len:269 (+),score=51.54 TRINITY_DN16500_c0_g2_i1:40-846(+)
MEVVGGSESALAASAGGAESAEAASTGSPSLRRPATVAQSGTVRQDGTILPQRSFPKDSRLSQLRTAAVTRTLGSETLAQQVIRPEGCSEEEWIAVHLMNLFNELNLLIGATAEWCDDQCCPEMTAGTTTYMWADGVECKTPISLSAPQYCERLLIWVDRQLADENFLPVEPGVPFPPTYRKVVRTIYKRLFRIYAHMFHAHFLQWKAAEAEAHLFHSFKHFIFFVKEFDLIDDEQLEPMKDLVDVYANERRASKVSNAPRRIQKLIP